MHKFIWLLALTGHVLALVPTPEERANIIEQFTRVRENVTPTASYMNLLTYSEKMEELAEKWVLRCLRRHPNIYLNPEYFRTGMLQYLTSNLTQRFENVTTWVHMAKDYSLERNYSPKRLCYYYKVMVWATATGVGCATTTCYSERYSRLLNAVVCFFDNVENNLDLPPYEKGESCSKCPQGTECLRNQCSPTTQQAGGLSNSIPPHRNTTLSFTTQREANTTSSPLRHALLTALMPAYFSVWNSAPKTTCAVAIINAAMLAILTPV